MLHPPDQFQRRVYVKLPYTEQYLQSEKGAEMVRVQLRKAFSRPLLKVTISPEIQPRKETPV